MRKKKARFIRAEALALSTMMVTMNVIPALADNQAPEISIESNELEEGTEDLEEVEGTEDLESSEDSESENEGQEDTDIETEGENKEEDIDTDNKVDTESSESSESENLDDTESENDSLKEEENTDIENDISNNDKDDIDNSEDEIIDNEVDTDEDLENDLKEDKEEVPVQVATPSEAEKVEEETLEEEKLEKETMILALEEVEVVYGEWNDSSDGLWQFKPSEEDGTCEIKPLAEEMKTGEVIVPRKIDGFEVTGIGEKAWFKCKNITTINVLDNIEVINESAFEGCKSLKEVNIPNVKEIKNYVFSDCTSLENVNILNVEIIGVSVFENCTSLKEVDIPNVKLIEKSTFRICESLEKINMSNVQTIGYRAFEDCSSLVEVNMLNIENIEDEAFSGCSSLLEVDMPNIKTIGKSAFTSCSALREINMTSVETIGESAFCYCISLPKINIPNVKAIEYSTFYRCSLLTQINVPNVETIGNEAFKYCTSLPEINIQKATLIGDEAFAECSRLETVNMGDVETIGNYAFLKCKYLKRVNMGTIKNMGKAAFAHCWLLSILNWTNNLEALPDFAFYKCSSLKEIDLGNITSIGIQALFGCNNIKELTIPEGVNSVYLVDLPGEYDYSGRADLDLGYKLILLGDNTDFQHYRSGRSWWNNKLEYIYWGDSIIINELVLPSKESKAYKKIMGTDNSDMITLVDNSEAKVIYHAVNNKAKSEYEDSLWADMRILEDNDNQDVQHTIIKRVRVSGEEPDIIKNTVTYYLNDGTDTIFKSEEVKEGNTPSIDIEPTRDGYEFKGWFKDPEGTQPVDVNETISEDTSLYAKWEKIEEDNKPEKKTITYYTNDGTDSIYKTEKVDEGKTPDTSGEPKRDGYKFIGWFKDSQCKEPVNPNEPINEDTELYAGWEKNDTGGNGGSTDNDDNKTEKKTVTYYTNNGTPDIYKTEEVERGKTPDTEGDEPKRDGYKFTGWYKDPEGKEPIDPNEPINEDTKLYAGWEKEEEKPDETPDKIKVTYYKNDGTPDIYKTEEVEKDKTPTIDDIPTRDGYEFTGWFKDPEGKEPIDTSKPLDKDVDLYAGWKKKDTIPTGNGGGSNGGGSHSNPDSTTTVTEVNVKEDTDPTPTPQPQNDTQEDSLETSTLDENGIPKDRAEEEKQSTPSEKDGLPKTGDRRNLLVYWITLVSSLSSLVIMSIKDKARKIRSK